MAPLDKSVEFPADEKVCAHLRSAAFSPRPCANANPQPRCGSGLSHRADAHPLVVAMRSQFSLSALLENSFTLQRTRAEAGAAGAQLSGEDSPVPVADGVLPAENGSVAEADSVLEDVTLPAEDGALPAQDAAVNATPQALPDMPDPVPTNTSAIALAI